MSILDRINPKYAKDNIWKIGIYLVANKRTYMTLVAIYLLTMPGATAKTIGFTVLVGEYAGFIFEIPSGYLSDKIGHKNALIISRVCMAASTLMYVLADHIWFFYAGAILMSIGFSFSSGTLSAFMHNTLKELKKEDQYSQIMGRLKSIGFAIPVLFILLIPIIAQRYGMQAAFLIAFVIDLIGLASTLLLKRPTQTNQTEELKPYNFKQSLKLFFNLPWIPFIVASAIAGGVYFGTIAGFKNPYQESLGFSISMLGVLWAVSRVIISQVIWFSGAIKKHLTLRHIVLIRSFGYGLGIFTAGIATNKWIIATVFIFMAVIRNSLAPAYTHHLLEYIPPQSSKATLLSIQQQFFKILSGLFAVIMGYLVVNHGFADAHSLTGALLIIISISLIWCLPKTVAKNK